MRGKIILIEGTDCSGKQTQSEKLIEYLNNRGIETIKIGFPDYESPTGKIIGGPYLGKEAICKGWFKEGAPSVSPKVSALYYAADFLYHLDYINETLDSGKWIVLDRYFYSTFAHQGSKERKKEKRLEMYKWFEQLEFDLLNLPDADIKIFLHMPYEWGLVLKKNRKEKPDELERSAEHLKQAEAAYKEIAKLYNFEKVSCASSKKLKTVEEIHKDVIKIVDKYI